MLSEAVKQIRKFCIKEIQFKLSPAKWVVIVSKPRFVDELGCTQYAKHSHYHDRDIPDLINNLSGLLHPVLKLWMVVLSRFQVYAAECVSEIKTILSIIFYSIYGAVCLQLTHFSCDDRENVYFILLSSSNQKYESLTTV